MSELPDTRPTTNRVSCRSFIRLIRDLIRHHSLISASLHGCQFQIPRQDSNARSWACN